MALAFFNSTTVASLAILSSYKPRHCGIGNESLLWLALCCVGLDDANSMVDTIRSVIGNCLKYIEELLFQGKEVVIIWLAKDGQLGCQEHLVEASRCQMGNSFLFLGCVLLAKSTKMMASRAKALAIASFAFFSAIETFVNPMADATA